MAEIKVSQLPEASAINDEDLLMIVQGGTNKKITKENCQFASGDEIAISTTEPTGEEKIWINPDEVPSGIGTDISNVYSDAQDKAYSCHYVNNSDSYSTSEIKTNKTWIDGKPIYRKVIVYDSNTPLANGHTDIPHNISNIGEYRKVEGKSFIYNGDTYGGYQSSTFNADVSSINATNIVIDINGWGNLFKKAFFTIEYTKTTD